MSKPDEPLPLTDEDNSRIRRLHEEIAGRFVEIGLILGRRMGKSDLGSIALGQGGRMMVTHKSGTPSAASSRPDDLPYICIEVGDGAWEDPPGWCRPGGCF